MLIDAFGDSYREKLVVAKTRFQLQERFRYLSTVVDGRHTHAGCYQDSGTTASVPELLDFPTLNRHHRNFHGTGQRHEHFVAVRIARIDLQHGCLGHAAIRSQNAVAGSLGRARPAEVVTSYASSRF
jgi:hypothetical protein